VRRPPPEPAPSFNTSFEPAATPLPEDPGAAIPAAGSNAYWLDGDDVTEFKVGGQNEGHIHIDFIKADGSWRLKEIWLCR